MIAPTTPIFVVMALAMLVLNWYAFRADANAAGHGAKQKLQMAAIWVTIFVGLTLVIGLLHG
ncbi:MAG: hypothetical protein ACKOPM_05390 [Novosphingobium sp.]